MTPKELYKKALNELSKRVDLEENPNYIIKLALEKAIANETFGNDYIKHLGNLWSQTQMVDIGSYTILKQALTELEELKKRDTKMKPRIDEDSSDVYRCPKCLGVVHEDYVSHDIYCHCCGQRLDWRN